MSTPPNDEARGAVTTESDDAPRDSFLGRHTAGLPHYLWIALAVTFALVFIPRGVRKALESNTNKAEDWLPASYAESADLQWFRDHFAGEAFVLISWDGCTLGQPEKLRLLAEKLRAETDKEGWGWYPRLVSGPETIEELITGPASLDRKAAIQRLEGALVGPEKVGPDGELLGAGSRTTCLLAYLDDRLTDKNLLMRKAVERVRDIAHEQCGVPLETIHLGGPPVENITIDIEGERTLIRLAGLSGIVGIALAYLCFRSGRLTAMVFWTAGASAGMSLSLVYWFGGFEKLLMGLDEPRLGKADAILMSMPAVVYVLALSGAIHLVNYYRDERQERGLFGAVERAVRVAWGPCLLAAFTTAVGLGSLGTSDILPIQKFGIFSAIGVMVAVALLFAMIPVFLHRFPPDGDAIAGRGRKRVKSGPAWYEPLAHFVTHRHGLASALCLAVMATVAIGLTKNRTSVQLLDLLDESCDLITDYTWLEVNLGNLVPMEVIVALDEEQLRSPDEPAVELIDGTAEGVAAPRYRMTMFERSQMARHLQDEIESLEPISRALSAATFSAEPQDDSGLSSFRGGVEYTTSNKLEDSRESLREYLLREETDGAESGRELWRVSARVTALGNVDYGQFVEALQAKVEPVLDAYRLRDQLVGELAEEGVALDRAKVCLLTATSDADNPRLPPAGTPEARLVDLLKSSAGVGLSVYPIDKHLASDEATRAKRRGQLAKYDAVIALDPTVAKRFIDEPNASTPLEVGLVSLDAASAERPKATEAMAVYTGVVPLVYKTQRELLTSLRVSIAWATVLIAGVMVLVLRSPAAGIASMIPNVFPIVMVFGGLGWLNIPIDIGIMMTASVAIGVAVDDTLHFVTWFGRGIRAGLDRRSATLQAYERCATAMLQTTMIGGLGLAVFAVSTFTPTQQFGTLMIIMLGMALVGDLILLPALLCGPLGRFFAPGSPATPEDALGWNTPIGETVIEEAPPSPKPDPALTPVVETPPAAPEAVAEPKAEAANPPNRKDEPLSPSNAALHSKLQSFRRLPSKDGSV